MQWNVLCIELYILMNIYFVPTIWKTLFQRVSMCNLKCLSLWNNEMGSVIESEYDILTP